jgi:hypothetical protein
MTAQSEIIVTLGVFRTTTRSHFMHPCHCDGHVNPIDCGEV